MAEQKFKPQGLPEAPGGYEPRDVNWRAVAVAGAMLLLVTGLATVLMYYVYLYIQVRGERKTGQPVTRLEQRPLLPAEPRLQLSPPLDMSVMIERQEAELNRYSWVDQKAGIAQIPVDKAMDLLAKQSVGKQTITTSETIQRRPFDSASGRFVTEPVR